MKPNIEIERKFLVSELPSDINLSNGIKIKQGYIFSNSEFELRLRKKGDTYYQTIKQGKGISRVESEIEITDLQFNSLWPLTENNRIEKTRYEITCVNFVIELDIFEGNHKNLKLAEVEFSSIEESKKIIIPKWFGKEVTLDENYKNKYLASQF